MRILVSPRHFGRQNIGLVLLGCTNRPVYQICVLPDRSLGRTYEGNIIEQVGIFDPLPNARNEKLVSLNFGRLKYWIGVKNAQISPPVLELLGLAGFLPLHPRTFIRAKENSLLLEQKQRQEEEERAKQETDGQQEQGEGVQATQTTAETVEAHDKQLTSATQA